MPRFRFGFYVLDSEAGVLEHNGSIVELRPKLVETLIPLIEAAPDVVSREALVERVWPDTHVVESALNRNVSELRKLFSAEFGEQTVIDTVSKRGYRFSIPVILESKPTIPVATPSPSREKSRTLLPMLAGGAVLLLLAVVGISRLRETSPPKDEAKSEKLAKSRESAQRSFRAGFALYDHWTAENLGLARIQFQQTIRLLPEDWFGYNGLCAAMVAEAVAGGAGFGDESAEIRRISELALFYGPQVAVNHSARGAVLLLLDWNWQAAEREIEAGVRWNPKNHVPLAYRGALRLAEGRWNEALSDFDAALQLKPKYDEASLGKAFTYYFRGDFSAAASIIDELLPLTNKKQAALRLKALALGSQNRLAEAAQTVKSAHVTPAQQLHAGAWLAAREGSKATALKLRSQIVTACHNANLGFCDTAAIDTALGRHDAAIDAVERAVRERHWKAIFLAIDPLLRPLHRHPRWTQIIAPIGRKAAQPD